MIKTIYATDTSITVSLCTHLAFLDRFRKLTESLKTAASIKTKYQKEPSSYKINMAWNTQPVHTYLYGEGIFGRFICNIKS